MCGAECDWTAWMSCLAVKTWPPTSTSAWGSYPRTWISAAPLPMLPACGPNILVDVSPRPFGWQAISVKIPYKWEGPAPDPLLSPHTSINRRQSQYLCHMTHTQTHKQARCTSTNRRQLRCNSHPPITSTSLMHRSCLIGGTRVFVARAPLHVHRYGAVIHQIVLRNLQCLKCGFSVCYCLTGCAET